MKRQNVLKCFATDEEKKAIDELAKKCSMSFSSYLRNRALGYNPKSALDAQKVIELSKINADLGRMGGLLKMWLSNDERLRAYDEQSVIKVIVSTLKKINANQDDIKTILKSIKF